MVGNRTVEVLIIVFIMAICTAMAGSVSDPNTVEEESHALTWSPGVKNTIRYKPSDTIQYHDASVEVRENESVDLVEEIGSVLVVRGGVVVEEIPEDWITEYRNGFLRYEPPGENTYIFGVDKVSLLSGGDNAKFTSEKIQNLTLEYSIERNNLTQIVLQKNLEKFNSNYYYEGHKLNNSSKLKELKQELFKLDIEFSKGSLTEKKEGLLPIITEERKKHDKLKINLTNKSRHTGKVDLYLDKEEFGNIAYFRFGNHSLNWYVTSQTDWDNVTASQLHTMATDGRLHLKSGIDVAIDGGYVNASGGQGNLSGTMDDVGGVGDVDDDGDLDVAYCTETTGGVIKTVDDSGSIIDTYGDTDGDGSADVDCYRAGGVGDFDGNGVGDKGVYWYGYSPADSADETFYAETGGEDFYKADPFGGYEVGKATDDFDGDGDYEMFGLLYDHLTHHDDGGETVEETSIDAETIGGLGDFDDDGYNEVAYENNGNLYHYDNSVENVDTGVDGVAEVGAIVDFDGDGDLDIVYLDGTVKYVDNAGNVHDTGVSAGEVGGAGDIDNDQASSGTWTSTWHDWGQDVLVNGVNQYVSSLGGGLEVNVQVSDDGSTVKDETGWITISSTGDITKEFSLQEAKYSRVQYDLTRGSTPLVSNYTVTAGTGVGAPTNLQNTTGNFYINYTWDSAGEGKTDSYNISVDSSNSSIVGWHNGTTEEYYNAPVDPHGWAGIEVYAYNNTNQNINDTPVSDNVTVPNNPIEITDTTDASVIEGNNVSIDFNYDDADGDTGTFATNATQGNFNTATGEYTWNTVVGDNGTYYWEFNVSDGHGSTDEYVALIDIVNASDVGMPINLEAETGNFWINWTWNPGTNTVSYNITKDDGTWLNGTTQEYYNATNLNPHDYWNVSVRGYNASVTGDTLSAPSSGIQQIPNNLITITNTSDASVVEGNTVFIDFDYSDIDGDTGTFDTNAAQGDLNTATGEFTWATVEDEDGTYEWTFNVSDGWGSVDEYTSTITVKKDGYVVDLSAGRWVLLYGDSSIDVTKTVVDTTDWIVLGNDQYQNYAAAAQVNLTTNVSFADVLINTSRSDLKSVVTGLSEISEVKNQRLEIPRVEDTGTVVVCPNATTLDEVSEGCSNRVKISSGETVDGMTVTEVTLGTQDYYEVSNVTGTGGIEFTPEEEEDGEPAPPEDGGGGAEPIETTVPPPPAPSPGEQPAPLPVIIGVIAIAAIILGLYFFARG